MDYFGTKLSCDVLKIWHIMEINRLTCSPVIWCSLFELLGCIAGNNVSEPVLSTHLQLRPLTVPPTCSPSYSQMHVNEPRGFGTCQIGCCCKVDKCAHEGRNVPGLVVTPWTKLCFKICRRSVLSKQNAVLRVPSLTCLLILLAPSGLSPRQARLSEHQPTCRTHMVFTTCVCVCVTSALHTHRSWT